MQPLASADDVRALGVEAEDDQIAASLARASARFRSVAANDITVSAYDMVLRPYGGTVRLPRTPVQSIDEVRLLNADGTDGPAVLLYEFNGIDVLTLASDVPVINASRVISDTVRVRWSAGYVEVPEDVRWAVASMVERALSAPGSGLTSESMGDYRWAGGGYTASGSFSMSRDERSTADKYRQRSVSMTARVG